VRESAPADAPVRPDDELAGHGHHSAGEAPRLTGPTSRRVRILLAALVLPILLATVAGLVWLWPDAGARLGQVPVAGEGVQFLTGRVVEVRATNGGVPADGTGNEPVPVEGADVDPVLIDGADVDPVRIDLDGEDGVVGVQVPPEILDAGVDVGARMKVLFIPEAMGSGSPYVFVDYVRSAPLALLAVLYAVTVVLVARWRGLAAIAGLAVSLGIIAVFVLPALLSGRHPLLVALVGSAAMMFAAVYLAHGVSVRTTTALLGTMVGLAITTVLAAWGTGAARLTGTGTDGSVQLLSLAPGLGLSALLLCGVVIAGLGALNDVTITQASAVWELHASAPHAPVRSVFTRAMRIGRDHIASTVYTLAFAYVGTALTTLLLVSLFDRSLVETLTAGEIAEEVVRTLVSSVGLVLAIPVTTGIGALLVRSAATARARTVPEGDGHRSPTTP
jgi:uncharacterized membrane protein